MVLAFVWACELVEMGCLIVRLRLQLLSIEGEVQTAQVIIWAKCVNLGRKSSFV